jgi:PPOX class probable FMN-dependent enzyme
MTLIAEQTTHRWHKPITSLDALREFVGTPSDVARNKELDSLDIHCRAFLDRSPFLLLGTAGANGTCDVSPKGDTPGFVLVLDDKTLVIPDRKGNRRVDSLQNILVNPHVGLLFLIPGVNETLRVNGTATIIQDDDILARMAVGGSVPQLAIVVTVDQCFLHCAKSFLRAKLWEPAHFVQRSELPSLSRMLLDQRRPADRSDAEHERLVRERDAVTAEAYQCLY